MKYNSKLFKPTYCNNILLKAFLTIQLNVTHSKVHHFKVSHFQGNWKTIKAPLNPSNTAAEEDMINSTMNDPIPCHQTPVMCPLNFPTTLPDRQLSSPKIGHLRDVPRHLNYCRGGKFSSGAAATAKSPPLLFRTIDLSGRKTK